LLSLCLAAEPSAESLRDTASKLTDFAVELRYPLPRRDPTEAEARGAIQIARHIRQFVRDVLPRELSQAADEAR